MVVEVHEDEADEADFHRGDEEAEGDVQVLVTKINMVGNQPGNDGAHDKAASDEEVGADGLGEINRMIVVAVIAGGGGGVGKGVAHGGWWIT